MRFPTVSREFEGTPGVADQVIIEAAGAVPSFYGESLADVCIVERWQHPDPRTTDERVTVAFHVEHATRDLDGAMVQAIVSRLSAGICRSTGLRCRTDEEAA